tara:strand:+ start:156 stop:320 length:165 start_codon:yes stop_codon:yes gene_type:complete
MLETVGIQARGLLHELEERFPPVNPSPYDQDREIMYSAGQRSVVEWIKQYMEEN